MPLTAEDVRNKRFTTVRLREGYDMSEVDQFLDEVEAELRRLGGEGDDLRSRLQAFTGEPMTSNGAVAPVADSGTAGACTTDSSATDSSATDSTTATSSPSHSGTAESDTVALDSADPGALTAVAEGPVASTSTETGMAPVERIEVTTTAEASAAAARLLELAGRSADQLVSEAEQKAEQIVGQARGEAEALETETAERRRTLIADVEQEKTRLDSEIEGLRTFEREYRAELRTYFEEQLAALDGQGAGGVLARSDRSADAPAGAAAATTDADQGSDPSQGSDPNSKPGSPLQSVLREDGS